MGKRTSIESTSLHESTSVGKETSQIANLQLIVESTDQGMFALDEQGRCTLFNRAASAMTGWPTEEVLGRNIHRFIHHSRPDGTPCPQGACPLLGVLRTGNGVRLDDEVFWRRDGTSFPAEYSSYPILEDGKTIGVVATLVDVTKRKEARESYRATLNILEDFDEEKQKLALLQQATMNLLEDVHAERSRSDDTQRATLNILDDFDAERRNLQQTQTATLNLLEDVNEERDKLEDTRRALTNILEDVEAERVKTEKAKMLLEAANKELEAFSYSVSHDLRAPLRAISGFAEAVIEDYTPKLDNDGKRYLGLITENANKMGQLIDDLLTFSRLGRQQIIKTEIDIGALAKSVFEALLEQVPHSRIELKIKPVPPACGDRAMIQQVLINLLSNAVKFTRSIEQALIEFGYLPEQENGAYYIKDNGVGFDMQYVDKLFGIFQRLHAVTEFEGTGVGLALVHRIVTRHGGRVWAMGKVNQGATFYFTLPEGETNEE